MPDPIISILANWSNIFSLLIAIALLAIAIIEFRRIRKPPVLSYVPYPISAPMLFGVGEYLESQLNLEYKGQKLQDLRVMQIRLVNTSNMDILPNHLVRPITFTFEKETELLAPPQIVSALHRDSGAKCQIISPNVASLDFELLNRTEDMVIDFVWSGPVSEPTVTARIKGISDIKRVEPDELGVSRIYWFFSSIFYVLIIFGIVLGIPVALLVGGGLVTNILSPKDFFVGLAAGFILAGIMGFLGTTITTRLGW